MTPAMAVTARHLKPVCSANASPAPQTVPTNSAVSPMAAAMPAMAIAQMARPATGEPASVPLSVTAQPAEMMILVVDSATAPAHLGKPAMRGSVCVRHSAMVPSVERMIAAAELAKTVHAPAIKKIAKTESANACQHVAARFAVQTTAAVAPATAAALMAIRPAPTKLPVSVKQPSVELTAAPTGRVALAQVRISAVPTTGTVPERRVAVATTNSAQTPTAHVARPTPHAKTAAHAALAEIDASTTRMGTTEPTMSAAQAEISTATTRPPVAQMGSAVTATMTTTQSMTSVAPTIVTCVWTQETAVLPTSAAAMTMTATQAMTLVALLDRAHSKMTQVNGPAATRPLATAGTLGHAATVIRPVTLTRMMW